MSNTDLDSEEAIKRMREEPDYDRIKSEVLTLLADNRDIVLATSSKNRVTARTVSFTSKDLDIYFLSWEHNKKIEQIKENPNVALTLRNVQIEGIAEVLGWAFNKEHKEIGDLFRAKFSPKWFDTFSEIKEMVLVKITPEKIVKFENIYKRFQFQNFDLKNKKVYQMRIEDKDNPNFPY
ncbi:MAG: pyridoxamine 5'-phosphate oxidase family protein [Candidatus Heimdallarchaeota archaeon]